MKNHKCEQRIDVSKLVQKEELTKEQKVIKKALNVLSRVGDPVFLSSENRFKSKLKPDDEARIWYARGLLESLLFNDDENE